MTDNQNGNFNREPSAEEAPLNIETIVETSLYSNDLSAMEHFYSQILKLPVIGKEAGRHVFFRVGAKSVLLIFNPTSTLAGHHLPAHGSGGPGHVALGVQRLQIDLWRTRLIEHQIEIEKEMAWPRGGVSIYFRDPAGNSIELITPGVWGTPDGW